MSSKRGVRKSKLNCLQPNTEPGHPPLPDLKVLDVLLHKVLFACHHHFSSNCVQVCVMQFIRLLCQHIRRFQDSIPEEEQE